MPLIFISALVYAIVTDFEVVGGLTIALLGVFAAIALVLDFGATAYGARRFGASNWGTAGGAIGGIAGALVGALFLGIGAILGLLLGTIGASSSASTSSAGNEKPPITANSPGCGRRGARGDWRRSSRAAGGVLVGLRGLRNRGGLPRRLERDRLRDRAV